jgi:hypothetical protein
VPSLVSSARGPEPAASPGKPHPGLTLVTTPGIIERSAAALGAEWIQHQEESPMSMFSRRLVLRAGDRVRGRCVAAASSTTSTSCTSTTTNLRNEDVVHAARQQEGTPAWRSFVANLKRRGVELRADVRGPANRDVQVTCRKLCRASGGPCKYTGKDERRHGAWGSRRSTSTPWSEGPDGGAGQAQGARRREEPVAGRAGPDEAGDRGRRG